MYEHASTTRVAGAEIAWTRAPPMLGPATNDIARLPCMIEPPSTKRSRGMSLTKTGLYETWKSTLSVPIRNATTSMCGNVSASNA